jgi:hypothetical protein
MVNAFTIMCHTVNGKSISTIALKEREREREKE